MKTIFQILLILCIATTTVTAQGNHKPINLSRSSNGKYAVDLAEKSPTGFVYQITRVSDGHVLLDIPSTYQQNEKSNYKWAKDHATSAEVFWNPESSAVAISEATHQFMGTVFVATISGSSATQIALPVKELIKDTGERWNQVRMFVRKGWSSNDSLKLLITGKCFVNKISGKAISPGTVSYDAYLHLAQCLKPTSMIKKP